MNIIESFNVLATLLAQRIVGCTGSAQTVGYPENAQRPILGVTQDTVKDINEAIPVKCFGKAKVYFNDTCAAGALIASDTSGRGIPFTPANTVGAGLTLGTAIVGVSLEVVSATGTIAQVMVNPQMAR